MNIFNIIISSVFSEYNLIINTNHNKVYSVNLIRNCEEGKTIFNKEVLGKKNSQIKIKLKECEQPYITEYEIAITNLNIKSILLAYR